MNGAVSLDVTRLVLAPEADRRRAAMARAAEGKARVQEEVSPLPKTELAALVQAAAEAESVVTEAQKALEHRRKKQRAAVAERQKLVQTLEAELWASHGTAQRGNTVRYVEIRNKLAVAQRALRTLQFPIRFVELRDKPFDSAYMLERTDDGTNFAAAPIAVLRQRQNVDDMVVEHIAAAATTQVGGDANAVVAPVTIVDESVAVEPVDNGGFQTTESYSKTSKRAFMRLNPVAPG